MNAHRQLVARVPAIAAQSCTMIARTLLPLLLAMPLVAVGCAATAAPKAPSVDEVSRACRTDADCAVKDVGNCCGYYPACVNRDSPVFPQRVKAECMRKNMAGICGFPVIKGCACVAGSCSDVLGPSE